MIFQDFEVEMRDRVGVLETAVDNAVDHSFPRNVMRDIVIFTHVEVFRPAFLGDPPARVESMMVRLQPGARAVRAKPPPEGDRLPRNAAESCRDCC